MTRPSLDELLALFPAEGHPACTEVPGDAVPEPYHGLLVHEHHMTVTVEAYHGSPVDVRVLEARQDGQLYSRRILLVLQASGEVVQFGIVRIDLSQLAPEARERIVEGKTPVGRVLIEHDVLRRVEPTTYLRFPSAPWFGGQATYGRLAIIHFDGEPAVEVLEVVAP
jgi:chorismate-pyruvate lyase